MLKNATLDVPTWPADNLPGLFGPVKFTNGELIVPASPTFDTPRRMGIEQIVYGDVDRDGAQETIAAIYVRVESTSKQLVAFDRDRAGRIVTLGSVVSTTGPVRVIDETNFRIQPNGVVNARVGDYEGCCGDETPVQWQWRSYAWDGQRFSQVGGPATFPVNPAVTETGVAADELVLGPAVDGVRHGTLTVAVSYLYGAVPDHLTIEFFLDPPNNVKPDLAAWPATYPGKHGGLAVDVPTPAKGVGKSYTFAFSRSAGDPDATFWLLVSGDNAKNKLLSESSMFNSAATVSVRSNG